VKISTEHRDALNEALDETAGYEGDVYVFDVKHIEILRSAVIAMLEDDEQIAAVAPAVDAQPVAEVVGTEAVSWVRVIKNGLRPGDKLYASAQSEGLRKDAERYRHLRQCNSGSLVIVQIIGTGEDDQIVLTEEHADEAIDAALSQHTGEKDD
jgi:hypothetical protein